MSFLSRIFGGGRQPSDKFENEDHMKAFVILALLEGIEWRKVVGTLQEQFGIPKENAVETILVANEAMQKQMRSKGQFQTGEQWRRGGLSSDAEAPKFEPGGQNAERQWRPRCGGS